MKRRSRLCPFNGLFTSSRLSRLAYSVIHWYMRYMFESDVKLYGKIAQISE